MTAREWYRIFIDNPYLKPSEIAILTGKSIKHVQRMKKKCKLSADGYGWGNGYSKRPFVGIAIRKPMGRLSVDVWNNYEWLHTKYEVERLGLKAIARQVGVNIARIKHRLLFFGIKMRPNTYGSTNPCCTKEWLEEHYDIQNFSLRKCAALANVSAYTICNWLIKFGMVIRDNLEAQFGERGSFYGKKHPPEILEKCRINSINGRRKKHNISTGEVATSQSIPISS